MSRRRRAGFSPGQFNMLTVFGVGEVPISLSGDPAASSRLVHTIRAVGRVSAALAALRPGEPLGLRGPFGVGWPMAEMAGRDILVIAGGLGLAPLRPALYRLLAERGRFGKVKLLYGTRSPDDILFSREFELVAAPARRRGHGRPRRIRLEWPCRRGDDPHFTRRLRPAAHDRPGLRA